MIKPVIIKYIHISDYSMFFDCYSDFFTKLLTSSEILKLKKYKLLRDKVNFFLGRAIVRNHFGIFNEEFTFNNYNKPLISSEKNFNITHTDGLVAVAFSNNYDIGIDVEKLSKIDINSLLPYFTSKDEKKNILSKNSEQKYKEFYKVWTLKEAYLKAKGIGLINDLQSINTFDMKKRNTYTKILGRDERYFLSGYVYSDAEIDFKFTLNELDQNFIT